MYRMSIAAIVRYRELPRTTEYEQIINKNDKIAYQTSRFILELLGLELVTAIIRKINQALSLNIKDFSVFLLKFIYDRCIITKNG